MTPGRWDARRVVRRVGLPSSLVGKRCLAIGTDDGFWAFELERRGAAEVVYVRDAPSGWDWPAVARVEDRDRVRELYTDDGAFDVARRALGSRVEDVHLPLYDVSPQSLGKFDFAIVAFVLFHLRDPVRALAAVRSVLRGELLLTDHVSLVLSLLRPRSAAADLHARELPHWWAPNVTGLERLVEAAGFDVVRSGCPHFVRPGAGRSVTRGPRPPGASAARRLLARLGVANGWVLARPAPNATRSP